MKKRIIIAGIGTDVGKTLASAIVVESLKADYWKPIQSGNTEGTDSETIRSLISNNKSFIHLETYSFKAAIAPNLAGKLEGITMNPAQLIPPTTSNTLIIELAGGLLVPITNDFLFIDLIKQLDAEVILVSHNYLGSINHTLLSLEALATRSIKVSGIIFNGIPNEETENAILTLSNQTRLLSINKETSISKSTILKYAKEFKLSF